MRLRQQSRKNGRYVLGPPAEHPGFSVLPRVSTDRFCMTMASASEFRDLDRRDARLDEVDDVGLGEHAALGRDVVQLAVVERDLDDLFRSADRP